VAVTPGFAPVRIERRTKVRHSTFVAMATWSATMKKLLIVTMTAAAFGLIAVALPADAATRNELTAKAAQAGPLELSARRYHRSYRRHVYRYYRRPVYRYYRRPYYYARPYVYPYRYYYGGYYPYRYHYLYAYYYRRPVFYFGFGF
jgi:hypothetical protein